MPQEGLNPPKPAPSVPIEAQDSVLLPALARLGVPVLIFGGAFFCLVAGLTLLLTPDRFPVNIGTRSVRLSDLTAEERALRATEAALLDRRAALKLEDKAPVLHRVTEIQRTITPVGRTLLSVEDVRASFKTPEADPISLPRVTVDGGQRTIVLGGDVRDVGGRSMAILASFVDGLRTIPLVSSVSEPEYVSLPLPGGGTESPFTLTITLAHE